jgi:hypothetical protein
MSKQVEAIEMEEVTSGLAVTRQLRPDLKGHDFAPAKKPQEKRLGFKPLRDVVSEAAVIVPYCYPRLSS